MWQAFLPGAEGEGEEDEEEASQDENGSGRAHAGHGPGQVVVHGDGVVAGQQGQDGLMEHQDGQQDQDTCCTGPTAGYGGGQGAAATRAQGVPT